MYAYMYFGIVQTFTDMVGKFFIYFRKPKIISPSKIAQLQTMAVWLENQDPDQLIAMMSFIIKLAVLVLYSWWLGSQPK